MDNVQPETTVSDDTNRQPTPEELAAFVAKNKADKRIAAAKAQADAPVYNRTTKNKGHGTPKAKRRMAAQSRKQNRSR